MPFIRHIIALAAICQAFGVYGQCTIDIGNDTTVCAGQPVTVTGPAGFPTYTWSDGTSGQSITTTNPGWVWCEVSYPTGELVDNGDFDQGNTGFTTDYLLNDPVWNDPEYNITWDASQIHPGFDGFGHNFGNFFVGNGGSNSPGLHPWCQQVVDLCPNTNYQISSWFCSVEVQHPAEIQFDLNGVNVGPVFNPPAGPGVWAQHSVTWNSGNSTTLDFCIVNWNGWGAGNDFGIDDISMSATVVIRDSMLITHIPLPVVDLGNDSTLCDGEVLTLDVTRPGSTYEWQDLSTNGTFDVSTDGGYSVTVTENGCSSSDNIVVNYNPLPVVDLGPDTTLCQGQVLALNASLFGATYEWQDGSTNASFNASAAGIYWVDVEKFGCITRDSITVSIQALPVVTLGNDTTLCAGETLTLDATNAGASYEWQDNSTNATFDVNSAGLYSVDVTIGACLVSDAINVFYNPLPVVDLGNDTAICQGASLLLDATLAGASYSWQDGSTNPTFSTSISGTFWVDVTLNGCVKRDSIDVLVAPIPTVDLGNDTTLCAGETLTLDATNAGASYEWQDNSTNPTFDVNSAGLYSVDVTIGACLVSDAINVFYNPLPVVDLGNDTAICQGASLLLDATLAGASYSWQDGSINPTFNTSTSGTFWVDVTLNGCTERDSIDVLVAPIPTVELGNDTTLCAGETLTLDATNAGASYEWQDNSTNPTFDVSSAGLYNVDVSIGACLVSDAIIVSYNPLPTVGLGNDTAICQGASLLLDATLAGASYSWQDGSINPTFNTSTSGTFWVDVSLNGCVKRDSIDVLVAPVPTVALGNDTTLCAGETLTLDATNAGASYEWQDNSTNPTFDVNSAGLYSVDVTIGACLASDAINVSYNPLPVVELGNDTAICQGASLQLDATLAGASYSWQDGSTNPSFNTSTSGTFWVDVTLNGCVKRDSIDVLVAPVPVVDLGPDQTICAGGVATFDATWPGASYLWNDNSTVPTLNASTAGQVWVDVSVGSCTDSDTALVIVQGFINVALGNDTTLCIGDQYTLDATLGGATYLWNDNSIAATHIAEPGNTYWVDVTVGNCFATDTIVIASAPVPTVNFGNDTTLCAGATLSLDASYAGASYTWQDNSMAATFNVSGPGQYWVDITLGNCTATDTIDVDYISPQGINLGNDTAICQGATLTLDASVPGGTYTWQDNSNTATFNVNSAGSYWVDVSSNGCSATDTINVAITLPPVVDLGPDTVVCPGASVLLDATTAGGSYLWSNAGIGPTTTVSALGEHWVEVTVNGCPARDTIELSHFNLPIVNIGNDTTLCPGADILLDATTAGGSYAWQDGSFGNTFTAATAGIFWVDVAVNGCVVRDSVEVSYLSAVALDLGNDTTLCAGQTLQLNANLPGATFEWQDGSVMPTYNVSGAGTYWVEATASGCSVSDTVEVDYLPIPTVALGNDTTICAGTSLLLDATQTGGTYTWQDASNGATFNASSAGNYWVEVSVSGCTNTDTLNLSIQTLPVVALGPDTTLCLGETLLLDATVPGASYEWQDASTAATFNVSAGGSYWVELTQNYCSNSDTIQVQYVDPGSLSLGNDTALCTGATLVLDATTAGVDYLWQDGSTNATYTASGTGIYWVEVSLSSCSARDSITISQAPMPVVDLGPDTQLCVGATMTLSASQANATYVWQDGSTNATFQVNSAGIYSVDVDLNGCVASDAISIGSIDVPAVALPVVVPICEGETVDLDVSYPNADYLWQDGNTNAIYTAEQPGEYSVSVSNECGITDLSTTVELQSCECVLYVPNAFTPDADGHNDNFKPVLECEPLTYTLHIFNRWGEEVFQSYDENAAWDGTYLGELVQDGVYVWLVEFTAISAEGPQSERQLGHVSVLR